MSSSSKMSMPSYQELNNMYDTIANLPIVRNLIDKNKQLRKENRALKNLIYSIPEFRCKCSNVSLPTVPENLEEPRVAIKKEK
jgi:hypothetical protein